MTERERPDPGSESEPDGGQEDRLSPELETPAEAGSESSLPEPSPPDLRPAPPTAVHVRPLPSPRPDEHRFDNPTRLPGTRPLPPRPKPDGPPVQRLSPPEAAPLAPPAPSDTARQASKPDSQAAVAQPERVPGDVPYAPPAAELQKMPARHGSLYGFVLYLALAIGTTPLPGEIRYLVLWLLLLALGAAFLLFDTERPLSGPIDLLQVTWGLGFGFVLSLPLMLLASRALSRTTAALIPVESLPGLFQALVLTWPLGETLFYRGVIQRQYGLVPAALLAGLGNLLLYLPETGGLFAVIFVSLVFTTVLALVYGYLRRQYGLAAAYTCQVAANLMLVFLPRLLVPLN